MFAPSHNLALRHHLAGIRPPPPPPTFASATTITSATRIYPPSPPLRALSVPHGLAWGFRRCSGGGGVPETARDHTGESARGGEGAGEVGDSNHRALQRRGAWPHGARYRRDFLGACRAVLPRSSAVSLMDRILGTPTPTVIPSSSSLGLAGASAAVRGWDFMDSPLQRAAESHLNYDAATGGCCRHCALFPMPEHGVRAGSSDLGPTPPVDRAPMVPVAPPTMAVQRSREAHGPPASERRQMSKLPGEPIMGHLSGRRGMPPMATSQTG